MSSASDFLGGSGGGKLGSADYTAGSALTAGDRVKLGLDGKVYPEFQEGNYLSTVASSFGESEPFKAIELGNGHFVTSGILDATTKANPYLFGLTMSGDAISNPDLDFNAWTGSTNTLSTDIVPVTGFTDRFVLAWSPDTTYINAQVGTFDGSTFSFGTATWKNTPASGRIDKVTLLDMGDIDGTSIRLVAIGEWNGYNRLAYNFDVNKSTGALTAYGGGVYIQHYNSFGLDEPYKINAVVQRKHDGTAVGYLAVIPIPDPSSGIHHMIQWCNSGMGSASGAKLYLDSSRDYSHARPSGMIRESDTELLVVAMSGFQFDKDQDGFNGVTNPVETKSGDVMTVYAITNTAANYTTPVISGEDEKLKLDPVIGEQNGGKTPVHIVKDSDGNYVISYNGILHKVSVDWGTRTVTKIWSGVDKRHDTLSLPHLNFDGSTYDASSTSKSSLVPISGDRYMYSDNGQGAGAIQLFQESFLSAGELMPIGTAQTSVAKDATVTVSLNPKLNSVDTGDTYTVGEIVDGDARALTTSVIAESVPEFEEDEDDFELSDCEFFELGALGWTIQSGGNYGFGGGAYLVQTVDGTQPLKEFLNIKGGGFIKRMYIGNTTATANTPDFDVIIDGEIYASNRNKNQFTDSYQAIVGARDGSIYKEGEGIRFKKSLIVKARNLTGIAAQSVIVSAAILTRRSK